VILVNGVDDALETTPFPETCGKMPRASNWPRRPRFHGRLANGVAVEERAV